MEPLVFLGPHSAHITRNRRLLVQVVWIEENPTNEPPGKPATSPFAYGSTACAAWQEHPGGARPIRRSAARVLWPFCGDESGFRSGAGERRGQACRPVEVAVAHPSCTGSINRGTGNGVTLPRHGGAVQTPQFHGLCLTMRIDLLLCAQETARGDA